MSRRRVRRHRLGPLRGSPSCALGEDRAVLRRPGKASFGPSGTNSPHYDRLVTWCKGPVRPVYLTLEQWNAMPGELTLQMDHLSCRSPEVVERELRMHLLVHNLARRMALEAVGRHQGDLERISFAGTLALMHAYGEAMLRARSQRKRRDLLHEFYRRLAAQQVPLRPGRREPRAVKRRPKPYPLLTCDRHTCREIPHRNRYRATPATPKTKGPK